MGRSSSPSACVNVWSLLRQVSVGIENISDIIADFDNALKVVP